MVFDIGRICVKIAGRDAGKQCVVVDNIDANTVLIDGATRRRKCNIMHLEPTQQLIKLDKNAAHDAVVNALGIKYTKKTPKKAAARPKKQHKQAAS